MPTTHRSCPPIPPADSPALERKSSIDQFASFLSTYRKGGHMPIAFNILDTASCDGLGIRRVIAHANYPAYNGYIYPMASCVKEKEQYIVSDFQGTVSRPLPLCQGCRTKEDEHGRPIPDPYTYRQYVDEKILPLAANGPLTHSSKVRYRVGLDYYQAKRRLTPADDECSSTNVVS